jgi:hypothetical protein
VKKISLFVSVSRENGSKKKKIHFTAKFNMILKQCEKTPSNFYHQLGHNGVKDNKKMVEVTVGGLEQSAIN